MSVSPDPTSATAADAFRPYAEGGTPMVERFEDRAATLVVRARDGHSRFEPMPTPEALKRYYNGGFSEGGNAVYNVEAQFTPSVIEVAQGVRAFVQECAGFGETFRFHDFGCAYGALVWGFQQLGVEATGNEPNAAWVEQGNRFCGGALSSRPFAEHAGVHAGTLDLVTMLHVLEHLPDPVAALKQVREAPSTEGLIYICVPNAASIQYMQGGRRSDEAYLYPMHLQYLRALRCTTHAGRLVLSRSWSIRAVCPII